MSFSTLDYSRLNGTGFSLDSMRCLRALVVGAGVLGNEVVKTLGLLGVGSVTIVDPDVLESSNLASGLLFRFSSAIGRNKADLLAEAAQSLFPETSFEPLAKEIADVGLQKVARYDLLFSCVDNDLARLEIAYAAQRAHISVVDGALGVPGAAQGCVRVFPAGGSCFSCLLTEEARRGLLSRLHAPSACCSRGASGAGPTFGTPMIAAIVASLQVDQGLRALNHRDSRAFAYEVRLLPEPRFERFLLPQGRACPFHDGAATTVSPSLTAAETTVAELFRCAGWRHDSVMALVLDWPICAGARCKTCRVHWTPMLRVSAFRRHARCPACGSAQISETEIIQGVMPGSRWFDCTLAQLGMPEDHVYTFRKVA